MESGLALELIKELGAAGAVVALVIWTVLKPSPIRTAAEKQGLTDGDKLWFLENVRDPIVEKLDRPT